MLINTSSFRPVVINDSNQKGYVAGVAPNDKIIEPPVGFYKSCRESRMRPTLAGGRLGLSNAADCKPVALIVGVGSSGARTIEVRVVRGVSTVGSRRPVVAVRPAIVEGAPVVVAGIDTVERASRELRASIVATY